MNYCNLLRLYSRTQKIALASGLVRKLLFSAIKLEIASIKMTLGAQLD